jgi:hypothetical protein
MGDKSKGGQHTITRQKMHHSPYVDVDAKGNVV